MLTFFKHSVASLLLIVVSGLNGLYGQDSNSSYFNGASRLTEIGSTQEGLDASFGSFANDPSEVINGPIVFQDEMNGSADGGAGGGAGDAAAQANNPLANMTAFNLQNYYIGRLSGTDTNANQFIMRYAKPVSFLGRDWLIRASLPINTFPTMGDHKSGMGDLNIFAAALAKTQNPAVSVGFGPLIQAPTSTDDALGTNQWSMGLANVFFDGRSKKFQYGYLLTWQHKISGPSSNPEVNLGAFQSFAFYQLGNGLYLRSAPIWVYNFDNDSYSVPVGLGMGKVFTRGKTTYNVFAEPQWSVADQGSGQPEWQVFFALNLQYR